MKSFSKLVLVLFVFVSFQVFAFSTKVPEKKIFVDTVLEQLSAGDEQQKMAAKSLENKGIQYPQIYSHIQELIERSLSQPKDNAQYQNISWLIMGVGLIW